MIKKSKPRTRNLVVLSLIALVLIVAGVVVYATLIQKDTVEPTSSQEKNCTTYNGTIEEQCAEDYVGLPADEAVRKAEENGLYPKVVKRDGKIPGFTDFGGASIYFEVNSNTVTKAYFSDNRPISSP